MGVKHFYLWYKNHFSSCIEKKIENVDILCIDLNGLFHYCAQRVYKYGNGNINSHLLHPNRIQLLPKTNLSLFRDVCEKMENIRLTIRPKKKIILCVDGVAGLGKMNQQRQRRFKTGLVKDQSFNPNCFTPGTKLMDHLTKYIDWYIRSMITLNPEWQSLEIIFSNEKVPGEGEHKIMHFLKKFGTLQDKICIYGLDADLMMLGTLLPFDKLVIAREPDQGFMEFVNIQTFRNELLNMMRWEQDIMVPEQPSFRKSDALNDFILLSFLVGNDFLPTVPSLTVLDGAIDIILSFYRDIGSVYGHLTYENKITHHLSFQKEALAKFFQNLGKLEKTLLEKKYNSQQSFFPDPLIIKNMKLEDQYHRIDIDSYKTDYYSSKFCCHVTKEDIVDEYLVGMLWVLNYYKKGIPDWTWFYPHFYGPFITDFHDFLLNHWQPPKFKINEPIPPFLQLLMVLPQGSRDLLPEPLQQLMNPESPLGAYFPETFEVDLTGKRKDWEGIVILPTMNLAEFKREYDKLLPFIGYSDRNRNIMGKNFTYQFDKNRNGIFSSFYGNIPECPVAMSTLLF